MRARLAAIAVAALGLCCGNSSTYTPLITTVGTLTSAGLNGIPAGVTQIAVGGRFFTPSAVVFWNGKAQKTQYQSETALQVDLDPGLTDTAAIAQVTAQCDDTMRSAPFGVQVFESAQTVTFVTPHELALGAADAQISITGTGFRPTHVALWNGAPLQTAFVSATSLTAVVPAPLLAIPGDGFVQVSEPTCGPPLCTPLSLTGDVVRVGPSTRVVLASAASLAYGGSIGDIAWDATRGSLIASLADYWGNGFLHSLDLSGNLLAGVDEPYAELCPARHQLALSDQAQFVYAFVEACFTSPASSQTPLRYSLPSFDGGVTFHAFPMTNNFFEGVAQRLAPAPGAPATFAVFDDTAKLAIVDDIVARPATIDAAGVFAIEWGADASTLFALSDRGVVAYSVGGTGVTSSRPLSTTAFAPGRLRFVAHRLYGDNGENIDEQGGDSRPFAVRTPLFTRECAAAIDPGSGKAFYACRGSDFARNLVVRSFDLATQQPISSINLGSVQYPDATTNPTRLIRVESDGLVILADDRIYFYRGPFVQ